MLSQEKLQVQAVRLQVLHRVTQARIQVRHQAQAVQAAQATQAAQKVRAVRVQQRRVQDLREAVQATAAGDQRLVQVLDRAAQERINGSRVLVLALVINKYNLCFAD